MILVVFLQGQTSVNINAELNWQFLLKSSAIDLFLNNVLLQKNPQNWLHFDNSYSYNSIIRPGQFTAEAFDF